MVADDEENPIDDEEAAADWEAMVANEAAEGGADDDVASEWEAMMGGDEAAEADDKEAKVLNQDEIDNLLGFDIGDSQKSKTGIHAMLDNALLSFERLPMLEVVFDRFVRMMSTSLRNFTSDNVDVDIHSISSLRFGDYINSIPMPALLTMFKAVEWENFGIITIDSSLIYSLVDVLLGGRKSNRPIRVEGRAYTTIEQGIVKQMSELMLSDLGGAFDPLSPATFELERLETNPRFATIAHPSDAAVLLQLRVDMEERGGNVEIVFPFATLEPIRELLTQVFMGEKFGKDVKWEAHFGREVNNTSVEVMAELSPKKMMFEDVLKWQVGSTIVTNNKIDDDIVLTCNGIKMLSGKLGRVEEYVSVAVDKIINKKFR